MATPIPATSTNNLTPRTHPTRRNSSAREPRAAQALSVGWASTGISSYAFTPVSSPSPAHGPPGLHARGESSVSPSSSDAHDGPASSALNPPPQPNAQPHPHPQPQPEPQSEAAAASSDGLPPSIHLGEDLSVSSSTDAMPRPPVSAPRARRPTLDLPGPPLDLYTTDHKLALESTSPKPCIVPGNALHLIDDDPAAPRSATPPSVIIVGDESEHGAEPESDGDFDVMDGLGLGDGEGEAGEGAGVGIRRSASQPPGATGAPSGNGTVRPAPRVRFRSRVRITSGVHRHRHSVSATGGSTPGSTTSDSPSSSISAPLRYQADENAAWGPIGKRLSSYATSGGWQKRTQPQVQVQRYDGMPNGVRGEATRGRGGLRGARGYSERTPLLRPPAGGGVHSEDEDEDSQGMSEEERTMRASALRREEEAVFGKWPWRIFNRHWWWWHVEPVFCCCADDEYEEF
ncbi:hypothetical protein GSI_06900 [Ganoderma sinense ZZ0214-1]|uniref:Uncharacterized protein n=1 Tax=Ganoderma sinense ZZ0214-1 TaxID=1077348 RepID=A0A2G8SAF0_9APHY|nr:hypothetical protein GSI_06900 [Ganoderma sinense ZZ0214-1]